MKDLLPRIPQNSQKPERELGLADVLLPLITEGKNAIEAAVLPREVYDSRYDADPATADRLNMNEFRPRGDVAQTSPLGECLPP
jgi:hypothetical protein